MNKITNYFVLFIAVGFLFVYTAEAVTCQADIDCPGTQVCNTHSHWCVDCLSDADCAIDASQACNSSHRCKIATGFETVPCGCIGPTIYGTSHPASACINGTATSTACFGLCQYGMQMWHPVCD